MIHLSRSLLGKLILLPLLIGFLSLAAFDFGTISLKKLTRTHLENGWVRSRVRRGLSKRPTLYKAFTSAESKLKKNLTKPNSPEIEQEMSDLYETLATLGADANPLWANNSILESWCIRIFAPMQYKYSGYKRFLVMSALPLMCIVYGAYTSGAYKKIAPILGKMRKSAHGAHGWQMMVHPNPNKEVAFGDCDYYQCLGVDSTATDDLIKNNYKKLALRYHPDKNQGNPVASENFKRCNQAYATLIDTHKRAAYDAKLAAFAAREASGKPTDEGQGQLFSDKTEEGIMQWLAMYRSWRKGKIGKEHFKVVQWFNEGGAIYATAEEQKLFGEFMEALNEEKESAQMMYTKTVSRVRFAQKHALMLVGAGWLSINLLCYVYGVNTVRAHFTV